MFLVVFEDMWNNKESIAAEIGNLGDKIQTLTTSHGYTIEDFDKDKYNSDYPYQAGTIGAGFYDIDCLNQDEDTGRIMIFDVGNVITSDPIETLIKFYTKCIELDKEADYSSTFHEGALEVLESLFYMLEGKEYETK